MGYVYKIINATNNQFYIGCTSIDPYKRFKEHLHSAKVKLDIRYNYNSRLYRSMRKYGLKNFRIEVLVKCKNYFQKEIEYIKKLQPALNLKSGGNGYNLCHKNHFTRSISEGLLEYWRNVSKTDREKRIKNARVGSIKYWKNINRKGKNSPRWGKLHTKETKEKMRLAKLGKKRTITPNILKGYKKISRSLTGRKLNRQHIQKVKEYQSKRKKEPRAKKYILWNKEQKIIVYNLKKFCRDQQLSLITFNRRLKTGKKIFSLKNPKFNGWYIKYV